MGSKKQGLSKPFDVLECGSEDGFNVANWASRNLVRVSLAGEVVDVYENAEFNQPITSLAALPDGGLVVRERGDSHYGDGRFRVFRGLGLRVEWIAACVSLARK